MRAAPPLTVTANTSYFSADTAPASRGHGGAPGLLLELLALRSGGDLAVGGLCLQGCLQVHEALLLPQVHLPELFPAGHEALHLLLQLGRPVPRGTARAASLHA